MIRKIVHIDEDKCNGCGDCVPACAEGAIKIVNGKAVLDADNLCDGLGACLGECPQDAIKIIEREADEFDEAVVEQHLQAIGRPVTTHRHGQTPAAAPAASHHHGGGCPGSRAMSITPAATPAPGGNTHHQPSQLRQWPVQLHLVPITAPYLQGADLLIAADCVPFAYPNFHSDLLAGKVVVVGCPKLDDNTLYLEKLTEMFRSADIKSITVARMEVPCCGGISVAARQALTASGKNIPYHDIVIGIDGTIK